MQRDILYGSFRVSLKTTDVTAAGASLFIHSNGTEKIAFDLLSNDHYRAHLTPQNTVIQRNDKDAHSFTTPLQSPSADFTEYRFDWLPDRVDVFLNGQRIESFTDSISNKPSSVHLSHWTSGKEDWTHGPAERDAALAVSYLKAYFNTTNTARNDQFKEACETRRVTALEDSICSIPNGRAHSRPTSTNSTETDWMYFFSLAFKAWYSSCREFLKPVIEDCLRQSIWYKVVAQAYETCRQLDWLNYLSEAFKNHPLGRLMEGRVDTYDFVVLFLNFFTLACVIWMLAGA